MRFHFASTLLLLCLFFLADASTAQTPPPPDAADRSEGTGSASPRPLDAPIPLPFRSAATLYDNGPLVNSIGTGVGGADESVLQTSYFGHIVLGYGHQVSSTNRLADDFTIPPGETWSIDTITLFSYQTGSTTVSPITRLALQIWNGMPDDPGSSVIFGDLTVNCLTTSEWTNIYRVGESDTGVSTARPIMVNTCAVGTSLGPGTYWIDWHSEGNAALTGPWAPPITINGEFATGNALQTSDGGLTWFPVEDGAIVGQQGFPFIIDGVRLPVELTAFDALVDGQEIHLAWTTASETNNAGFEIQMHRGLDGWQTLAWVPGHGTTLRPQAYTYRARDLAPGRYAFRLKQIDFDGAFAYSPVAEAVVALPDQAALFEAYPNPMTTGPTTLGFVVPAPQQVRMVLYDLLGKPVQTLYTGRPRADVRHEVALRGTGLPNGRYGVQLQGETFSKTVLVTLAR